ncbi:GNAT family N-acetyltransferase [Streptomyces lydicus]|uniref:GNAT family N-acetyltransferase n=1 Tax=Streptomyces lydicus TaxID=47763 RepID=UPI0013E96746|nr:GNAT family N-acetyltransferase [Streptomyces lydicus]MCZ1012344.1 GNAT family N-acetyltransferase [Streptomyces lydicus]
MTAAPPVLHLARETNDNESFLLLYRDKTLVGYLEVIDCGDELWVMEIGVHPGHRGRGYGTRLLQDLLNKHPNAQIALSSSAFDPDHIWRQARAGLPDRALTAWYQRHGFSPDSNDEDSHRMVRPPDRTGEPTVPAPTQHGIGLRDSERPAATSLLPDPYRPTCLTQAGGAAHATAGA